MLAALLLAFSAFFSPTPTVGETIHYRIKPVPTTDRTNLEISVRFTTVNSDPVKIVLPTDTFGLPDIHRYITVFEAGPGSSVKPGEKEIERIVQPAADGTVSIRYVLSYDPKAMGEYPYSPNTTGSYFHVAGCQWMLHIGDDDKRQRYSVEILAAPKDWQLYSSIDRNAERFETVGSYKDLATSGIGGGAQWHSFSVERKPVTVFVHGEFAIPNKEIFSAVERIVRLQREWFEDYKQPFFVISIAPRNGITAGYAPRNAFFCFTGKNTTPEALNILLAHELFHYWLPNSIRIVQDDKYTDLRYEWFYEGFTDYFARRILREAGLITNEKFAELLNKDVLNIADNPHRSETYQDFIAAREESRFDGTYKLLSYYRGALIALNWDTQIRLTDGKRDLSDFIRQLLRLAAKDNGKVAEQAFFDFAKSYGVDVRVDLDRYIMRGETIHILPKALIENFILNEVEYPLFDPGFSLAETRKTRKVSGVVEDGAAYRAGLRNGMDLVSAQNSNRFSNSWQADKPMTVVVRVNRQERTFEFFPHGRRQKLSLFEPVRK